MSTACAAGMHGKYCERGNYGKAGMATVASVASKASKASMVTMASMARVTSMVFVGKPMGCVCEREREICE